MAAAPSITVIIETRQSIGFAKTPEDCQPSGVFCAMNNRPVKLPAFLEIRNSSIHGRGVYSREAIPKGGRVIEYVGERVGKRESERRAEAQLHKSKSGHGAVYLFEINSRYDIDGNVPWNPARHINHSCDPNCEAEQDGTRIWIAARRDIAANEELTYDYGYDVDSFEDHPCCCGSAQCVGYIVRRDQWPRLRKALARRKIV